MARMKRLLWIVIGYVLAALIGAVAVRMRHLGVDPRDVVASSGMWAFGDSMTSLIFGGGAALVPTFFLFRELRDRPGLWTAPSLVLLLWAVVGVIAAAIRFVPKTRGGTLAMLDMVAVLRFLVAPLFAGLDAAGWLALPETRAKQRLGPAAALEMLACTPWLPLLWQLTPFHR
jgi:hypothetical protein